MKLGTRNRLGVSRPNAPAMSRRGVFTAGFVALAALTPLAAHAQQATFTVLVENVSTSDALKLPNGPTIRAMIECIFGWGKQHGTLRKTKHRGLARVAADFLLNLIAYNLIRIPKIVVA